KVCNLEQGRIDEIDAITRPAAIGSTDRDLDADEVPAGHRQAVRLAHDKIQHVKKDTVVDPTIAMFLRQKELARGAQRLAAVHEVLAAKLVLHSSQVELKSSIHDTHHA